MPVSRFHANRALRFLERFMDESLPDPDFVPLADGGVQLEWHLEGRRIDLLTDEEIDEPVVLIQVGDQALEERAAASFDGAALRALFEG